MADIKVLRGAGGPSGPSYKDDNLYSKDRAELLLGISEGPIKGVQDGSLKNVFIGDTPVMSPTGKLNFEADDLQLLFCEGTSDQTAWAPVLGGAGQFHQVNVKITSQNMEVIRSVPTSLSGHYDRIDINLSIDRLVYNDEEGSDYANLDLEVAWRVAGKMGWQVVPGSHWRGKTTSGYKTQLSVYNLGYYVEEADVVELRVKRLSKDSDDQYMAELTWLGFDTVTTGEQKAHADLAQMHFYANSNEQLSGVPNISAIWDGLMVPVPTNYDPVNRTYDETTPWDGTFTLAKFWTDNPIWLTREMVKNPRFGLAAYNKYIRINEYSWYEHAKYCDEMVPDGRGGQQPRFTFNGVIHEIRDGNDLLNYILSSCNAVVKDDSQGLLKLYADRPNAAALLITPEMVEESQEGVRFNYNYTDVFSRANEIRASFINPNRNWEQDFISVRHAPAIEKYGLVLEEFEAIGCIDSHEATRKAMMRMLSAQTETATVSFTLNRMGIMLEPFQTILLADPSRHWSESRRAASLGGTTLTFKRPIYFEAPGTYQVKIASTAGIIERTANVPTRGNVTQLTLNKAVTNELAENFAFTVEGQNEIGMSKPFRVLRCDPADSFGLKFAVMAVEINRNKYNGSDTATYIDIDPYSYTKPTDAPSVTGLVVKVEKELVDGEYQLMLRMSWENPKGHSGIYHRIFANINGSGLQERGQTRGSSFEIRDVSYGMYQVQVFTQSMHGVGESEIVTVKAAGSNAEDWLMDPANLHIDVQPTFVGADLLVDCGATFVRDGFPVDLVTDGRVGAFVFEIQTPSGVKTRRTSGRQWLYRHVEMVEDFGGIPPATINISVKVADHRGRMAGNQPLVISSEGSAQITALRLMVRDTNINAVPLWNQPNVVQDVKWYISQTNSFAEADFIGRSAVLDYNNVSPSTTYYLWAEVPAEFGTAQIFPAANNGNKVVTLSMAQVVLPELEGSVGLDILDDSLQESIGKIPSLDDRLTAGLEDLDNTKNSLQDVKDRAEATDVKVSDLKDAVQDTLGQLDSLSDYTTQAIADVNESVRDIVEIRDTVDNVENHLGQIEADVEQAKTDFDSALNEVNSKVDQAQSDLDETRTEVGNLSDRVDQTNTSLGELGTSVDQKLSSTEEKLNAVDSELDAKSKELQDLINKNYAEYIDFRDAILEIDPETGQITIEALNVLKEEMRAEFSKVNLRIDSVASTVALKAEKTIVDEHGTKLTEVGQRLDAAEGQLEQKASIKQVEDNTTKLTEVSQGLDAVNGKLVQKAESAEVDAQGKRLAAAEQTLQATTSEVQSLAQANQNLSASLDRADQRLTAGLEDLGKVVADEKQATAERFTQLTTEVGDTKTKLGTLEQSVNTGQAATNQRLQEMQAEVDGNKGSISTLEKTVTDLESSTSTRLDKLTSDVGGNKAAINTLTETVATHEQASSQRFTEMESSVGQNSASITELDKTVTDLETSVAQKFSGLESEIGGNHAALTELKETNATEHAAMTKSVSELNAKTDKTNANLTALGQVVADGDKALADQITQMGTQFEDGLNTANANLTEAVKTLTTADKALGQRIDNLSASFTTENGKLSALINELAETVATADEALARQLKELATEVGENEAAITELRQVVTGADSSLAEIFQELHAQLDWIADTTAGNTADLDEEVQERIRGEAEIKRAQKVLVDTDQALAQLIEQLRVEFETNETLTQADINTLKTAIADQNQALAQVKQELLTQMKAGDRELDGKISTVIESVTTLTDSVQTMKSELEASISEGDTQLAGQLNSVSQNLVSLEQSLQSVKTELEGTISEGDKALDGKLTSVSQNLTTLTESVQTIKSELESSIEAGDKALDGKITHVTQNLTDLEKSLQTITSELRSSIEAGDKALDGKITNVSSNLTTLERTVQTMGTELSGQITAGDKALEGQLNTLSENVVELDKTVQTMGSDLSGQITAGDKALEGQLSTLNQNVVELDQTVQTMGTELTGQITEGDKALDGKIATVSKNLVTLEESLQTMQTELEGKITSGDTALSGSIKEVMQNVVTLTESLQSLRTDLESQITNGDTTLSGQISEVTEVVSNVEQTVAKVFRDLSAHFESVADTQADAAVATDDEVRERISADAALSEKQTVLANEQQALAQQLLEMKADYQKGDESLSAGLKELEKVQADDKQALALAKRELQTSIEKGDLELKGDITQLAESLTTLNETVQTVASELSNSIAEGDKALEGKISSVSQNLTTLEKTVQTQGTELTGKITEGDKALEGQIQSVQQNVVDLSKVVSEVETSLTGKIEDQGEVLEGAIQENMELMLNGGEPLFVVEEDLSIPAGGTHNLEVVVDDTYDMGEPGIVKGTIQNLPEGGTVQVTYAGAVQEVTTNGAFSLPIALRVGQAYLSIVNHSGARITLGAIRVLSQESRGHYAQWSVKSEVAGLKGGVGFINDGSKVVFALDVDTLVMYDRETGEVTTSPFYVQDGICYIKEAAIADAVITNKLKVGAKLYAPYIADREGPNPNFFMNGENGTIFGAKVRAGDIGIGAGGPYAGYHTFITGDGRIHSDNVYLKGHIEATSGVFKGRLEATDGYFHGTLHANQVRSALGSLSARGYSAGYIASDKKSAYWDLPGGYKSYSGSIALGVQYEGGGVRNITVTCKVGSTVVGSMVITCVEIGRKWVGTENAGDWVYTYGGTVAIPVSGMGSGRMIATIANAPFKYWVHGVSSFAGTMFTL
ncbi:phage tail protein [Photobacterium sp. GSS17]|uniref:phage tail protein n=1 Tax=Photobacterium sp. GSS17 TaxID=3020715 RepID=UPI00235DD4A5|nr:phage tail protein [Photobacterium sp. GSS17]